MFLNEVALGKEKHITKDDYKLTTAPEGYDSIVAKGRTEPGQHLSRIFIKVFFLIFYVFSALTILKYAHRLVIS